MSEPAYQKPDLALVGAEHVDRYRETDGEVGYEWNGVPVLLLTTTGRRSAEPRTKALIFGRHGDDYLVVASTGGAPKHPSWYLNLLAHPRAEIQVKGEHIPVVGRGVTAGAERERLWRAVNDYWPNYDTYQARTERLIPVVVLTPTTDT
ncbi:nitroreductase family deazaflavin-dependent oxidoreductase [Streptomyces sp. NPDC102360]|uniref:nitroreductase family deazaflavin-dependent oxidoreductase n=1 Tax=Streptomyces sp. NPDC102360 TaxID=3366160 RepID=UPI00382B517A